MESHHPYWSYKSYVLVSSFHCWLHLSENFSIAVVPLVASGAPAGLIRRVIFATDLKYRLVYLKYPKDIRLSNLQITEIYFLWFQTSEVQDQDKSWGSVSRKLCALETGSSGYVFMYHNGRTGFPRILYKGSNHLIKGLLLLPHWGFDSILIAGFLKKNLR